MLLLLMAKKNIVILYGVYLRFCRKNSYKAKYYTQKMVVYISN